MEAPCRCPYCAEEIRPEATRCPHCRSRLADLDPGHWFRDLPDRRLAGVAAAVALGLGISVAAARVAFIVLAFFHLVGPVLYGALWLIIPFAPGEPSLLERGVRRAQALLGRLLGGGDERAVRGGPHA
jgi:phage shock protein PspC (stress-responsive transcriptional regulator)